MGIKEWYGKYIGYPVVIPESKIWEMCAHTMLPFDVVHYALSRDTPKQQRERVAWYESMVERNNALIEKLTRANKEAVG
jgi:hypothetical protein